MHILLFLLCQEERLVPIETLPVDCHVVDYSQNYFGGRTFFKVYIFKNNE